MLLRALVKDLHKLLLPLATLPTGDFQPGRLELTIITKAANGVYTDGVRSHKEKQSRKDMAISRAGVLF